MLRCTVEEMDRAAPIVDSLNSLAAGYGGNRINRCRPHTIVCADCERRHRHRRGTMLLMLA
jgi:hypothetical protein